VSFVDDEGKTKEERGDDLESFLLKIWKCFKIQVRLRPNARNSDCDNFSHPHQRKLPPFLALWASVEIELKNCQGKFCEVIEVVV